MKEFSIPRCAECEPLVGPFLPCRSSQDNHKAFEKSLANQKAQLLVLLYIPFKKQLLGSSGSSQHQATNTLSLVTINGFVRIRCERSFVRTAWSSQRDAVRTEKTCDGCINSIYLATRTYCTVGPGQKMTMSLHNVGVVVSNPVCVRIGQANSRYQLSSVWKARAS